MMGSETIGSAITTALPTRVTFWRNDGCSLITGTGACKKLPELIIVSSCVRVLGSFLPASSQSKSDLYSVSWENVVEKDAAIAFSICGCKSSTSEE